MIKHIVMWRLKDKEKIMNAKEMKKRLEDLNDLIDEVIRIEVGINHLEGEQAFDVVLYSEFENKTNLALYQKHPEHLKVVEFIKAVTKERVFVDYEV